MPRHQHAFAYVSEPGVLLHGDSHVACGGGGGVAYGFDHFHLRFNGNTQCGDDKTLQRLARRPGLFPHDRNGRRVVLIACIDGCGHHVIGR